MPLRTFRELSALFAAKTTPPAPEPPRSEAPKPEEPPAAVTPPAPMPAEPPADSSNNALETSTPGANPTPGPEN